MMVKNDSAGECTSRQQSAGLGKKSVNIYLTDFYFTRGQRFYQCIESYLARLSLQQLTVLHLLVKPPYEY